MFPSWWGSKNQDIYFYTWIIIARIRADSSPRAAALLTPGAGSILAARGAAATVIIHVAIIAVNN